MRNIEVANLDTPTRVVWATDAALGNFQLGTSGAFALAVDSNVLRLKVGYQFPLVTVFGSIGEARESIDGQTRTTQELNFKLSASQPLGDYAEIDEEAFLEGRSHVLASGNHTAAGEAANTGASVALASELPVHFLSSGSRQVVFQPSLGLLARAPLIHQGDADAGMNPSIDPDPKLVRLIAEPELHLENRWTLSGAFKQVAAYVDGYYDYRYTGTPEQPAALAHAPSFWVLSAGVKLKR